MIWAPLAATALWLFLLVGLAPGISAQDPAGALQASETRASPQKASPSLPLDHWALTVLARWEALGLLPSNYLPAARSIPRMVAAEALRAASERAGALDPATAALARTLLSRFQEEFPETGIHGSRWRTALAVTHRSDIAKHDLSWDSMRVGTRLDPPDRLATAASVHGTWYPAPAVSLDAAPTVGVGHGIGLARWGIAGVIDPVEISVGREPVGYGFAEDRGVALTGAVGMTRLQLQSVRPFRLPWMLGQLGPVSFHGFVSRLTTGRHVGQPYFWGTTGVMRPHPRATIGVHRVIAFSGGSAPVPLTAQRVARMVVGITNDGFDNQIVSVSWRFRLPTDSVLPVTLYGEWGADDTAGAWFDSPGIVAGVYLPRAFGLASSAVGVEHAYFGNACRDCRRVADPVRWYSHFRHTGGWVEDGTPLGHPLAGNGTETRIYLRSRLAAGRAGLGVDLFARDRTRFNLYHPRWGGEGRGGSLQGDWHFSRRGTFMLHWNTEQAEAWRVHALRTSVSLAF